MAKIFNGTAYMREGKGALVPVSRIKPQHLQADARVRKVMGYAIALSAQIVRFKKHRFDDLGQFEALLSWPYSATVGGPKGNKQMASHDGLFKISVQVADNILFRSELQSANHWSMNA